MLNQMPIPDADAEMERNAYNAAFYELGFRWHWDTDTYAQLRQRSLGASERLSLYLQTAQPHLLKAYDADFLVAAIERKKETYRQCGPASAAPSFFNWAATQAGEVGA